MKSVFSGEILQEIANGSGFFNGVYFIRFEDSLLKCYWKNEIFDCANGFINHIGEFGPFFTFNLGKALALEILSEKIGTYCILHIYNHTVYYYLINYVMSYTYNHSVKPQILDGQNDYTNQISMNGISTEPNNG